MVRSSIAMTLIGFCIFMVRGGAGLMRCDLHCTAVADVLQPVLPDTTTSRGQPSVPRYTVRENDVLKFAKKQGTMSLLTRDGKVPPPGSDNARLVIGSATARSLIRNKRQFAEQRLMSAGSTINVAIIEAHEVKIDNLEGLELVADAVNTDTNKPVFMFQTILFSKTGYYMMQGFGPAEEKTECLEGFRKIAASFRRQ